MYPTVGPHGHRLAHATIRLLPCAVPCEVVLYALR